jgi:hypothetical protein
MTAPDDGQRDDPASGPSQGPVEPASSGGPPLDEDAAWRSIVENYGERVELDGPGADPSGPAAEGGPQARHPGAPPAARPSALDRSYLDAADAAAAPTRRRTDPGHDDAREDGSDDAPDDAPDDGGHHFIPPEPPPVPRGTPARRLAWAGLFGPPVVMVLAVLLRWTPPTVVTMALVSAFVGGFVFLVCTMPRDGGDGWDDGAVV